MSVPTWEYTLLKPVFFVGFMGAGKTSVARRLARVCGSTSVDVDRYIERREGATIGELFDLYGEAGFRAIETEVIDEFAHRDPVLVSCGGGAVISEQNRRIMKEHGFVVYLHVTAHEARQRIGNMESRPLFGDVEAAERLNTERCPLYEEVADATIETAGKGAGKLASEVQRALLEGGALCRRPR